MSKKQDSSAAEILELKTRLQRALADYDNLQKRTEKEKEETGLRAQIRLVTEFLPLYDLVVKAQLNLKDPALELVLKEFERLFDSLGIEKIGNTGEKFDPQYHEVVAVTPGKDQGTVAEVIHHGFRLGDWVLRPAQVKVIKND
jgi:molecular chaperone GrpE